jgi:two-component system, response regulator PdtaR
MVRVLIVEDEVLLAMDLEDIVLGAGHDVVGIAHDQHSVSLISRTPQVALVDLNLRDGPTGQDVALTLVGDGITRVVFVTANPNQIGWMPPGVVGYVMKPFQPDAITGAIAYAGHDEAAEVPPGLHVFLH